MDTRLRELHERTTVVDGHNHMMMELAKRRNRGEKAVFSEYWAPLLREAGVNVLMTNVGGDNCSLTDDSDLLLWGSISLLDMLLEEAAGTAFYKEKKRQAQNKLLNSEQNLIRLEDIIIEFED